MVSCGVPSTTFLHGWLREFYLGFRVFFLLYFKAICEINDYQKVRFIPPPTRRNHPVCCKLLSFSIALK
jgi:hypothetical protein